MANLNIIIDSSTEVSDADLQVTQPFDFPYYNESHYFQQAGSLHEDIWDTMPTRDSLYIVIPITVIYALIFFTGVIGNISTCIVISRNKSMHTATNYYLFSLAISDLLLLVSGLPQEMYFIWSRYPYVFGEVFCVLRGLAAETSANATVLTITAFTVERYVAICHPFLSHTMSKLSRAVKLIILIWFVSLAFAIPQALQFGIMVDHGVELCVVKRIILEHSFELSTFMFFITPMTLISVLYVLIGLRLRTSKMMKRESGACQLRTKQSGVSKQHQTAQSSRRVLKMLVAVVVAFFICWAPFHAQRLVAIYGTADNNQPSEPIMLQIYAIMTYTSGILYYLSTTINPLLYNIMSNKFREAFKETLGRCCNLSDPDTPRSYSVLSRTQLRTGQHYSRQDSTDYSGNSTRDDSMQSSATGKQSIETMSLGRQSSRRYLKESLITPTNIYQPKDLDNNFLNSRNISHDINRRQGEVRIYINEISPMGTVISVRNQNSTATAQQNVITALPPEQNYAKNFWKTLYCLKSKPYDEDDKLPSYYSPSFSPKLSVDVRKEEDKSEMFCMLSNDVTDNSLSGLSMYTSDRSVLQDELTIYMQEIRLREER